MKALGLSSILRQKNGAKRPVWSASTIACAKFKCPHALKRESGLRPEGLVQLFERSRLDDHRSSLGPWPFGAANVNE